MAIDTLLAYVGVYDRVGDAEADYELVKDLHTDAGLIDAYDAAVIERRDGGKTRIVKKHATPTRAGGVLGGGLGLATGLVVAQFPFAAVGGGLLLGATAGGAILGAVAGYAAAGLSRHDLKELGQDLDKAIVSAAVPAVPATTLESASACPERTRAAQRGASSDPHDLLAGTPRAGYSPPLVLPTPGRGGRPTDRRTTHPFPPHEPPVDSDPGSDETVHIQDKS